jgi:hypothetical protein
MKANVLKKLLDEGKKPMVRVMDSLWDESFGQEGMIARIVSIRDHDHDLYEFSFDYNEKREHNVALDEPIWFIESSGKKGTAIEAGQFDDPNNLKEEVYFEKNQDVPVVLVDDQTPMALYLASGSKQTYVEWLEGKLEELVPECMKEWKKGI